MKSSTSGGSEIEHLVGKNADAHPLVAERIAIDVTNAMRGAEVGLRSFRRRPLLRRIWDGITGEGQEKLAAIGQDMVTAQRATVSVVREVMENQERTQYCINRVLVNLHAVNRDVDELLRRTASLEHELDRRIAGLRSELYEALRTEAEALGQRIEAVERSVDREAAVRRLTERYRAGDLTEELGELLGSGLFVATVAWHYWAEDGRRVEAEFKAALAVVRQRVGRGPPKPAAELLLEASESVVPAYAETVAYLAQSSAGPLHAAGALAQRKLAGLPLRQDHAEDAVAITRSVSDPAGYLEPAFLRNAELVEYVALELLPATPAKES